MKSDRMKSALLAVVFLLRLTREVTLAEARNISFRSWRWHRLPSSRLDGHVMAVTTAHSLLHCAYFCAFTPTCVTVNFNRKNGVCEHNAADDRWSDVTAPVSDVSGFSYVRRSLPAGPQVNIFFSD
jgi:hypothetical protein